MVSIEDHQPERRNLVVMSMGIIAFYIGEGSVKGDEGIELPLVKLHFDNPEALGILAWIMLFWFALRYIHENHQYIYGQALGLLEGKSDLLNNSLFRWILVNAMLKGKLRSPTFMKWNVESVSINGAQGCLLRLSGSYRDEADDRIETNFIVPPLICYLVCCYISGRYIFTSNAISAYVAPLILFVVTIFVALITRLMG